MTFWFLANSNLLWRSLEAVANAIYLLKFYAVSSMCPATVWIISGLRSRRKNVTAPARSSSFHEHGSSSGALGFHECGSGSGALFFLGSDSSCSFCSFSLINISIVFVCFKLNGTWNISSTQNQENMPNLFE